MSIDYTHGVEDAADLLLKIPTRTPQARVTLAVAARVLREHLLNGVPLDQIVNAAPPPSPPQTDEGAACPVCNQRCGWQINLNDMGDRYTQCGRRGRASRASGRGTPNG